MNKFEVVSKYKDADVRLPSRATGGAAGYDFEVAENIIIPSISRLQNKMQAEKWKILEDPVKAVALDDITTATKQLKTKPTLVPTGIKCQLDEGFYLELSVRSSLPLKHWLILANGVGIVDSDYYNNKDNEGQIFFQLINLSPFDIQLRKGDRIGQGIIKPYYLVEGDSYNYGKKRTGGFGSTSGYINAPYIIGSDESISAEPKFITTSNVETEAPYFTITNVNPDSYQLTLDDIK